MVVGMTRHLLLQLLRGAITNDGSHPITALREALRDWDRISIWACEWADASPNEAEITTNGTSVTLRHGTFARVLYLAVGWGLVEESFVLPG